MLKLTAFAFYTIFCFIEATEVEDHCIIAHLKHRNLLNSTTFPNYHVRVKTKNCDQIVKKIVQGYYEENFELLEEGADVDNKTYIDCLMSEFDRHKIGEKYLKARAFENETEKEVLETIRDAFILNIKFNCSQILREEQIKRYKDFVSDKGGTAEKLERHPAIKAITDNLICMNQYAVEEKILDPLAYKLKLQPVSQTADECKQAVSDVIRLIMDEWHIRRYSEDDKIQRCFIDVLLHSQAVNLFIKNSLLSQMQLTQEQKDYERDNFIESMNKVHEMSYDCIAIGFEKI